MDIYIMDCLSGLDMLLLPEISVIYLLKFNVMSIIWNKGQNN